MARCDRRVKRRMDLDAVSKGPNSAIVLVSSEGLSLKKGVVCLFSRPVAGTWSQGKIVVLSI